MKKIIRVFATALIVAPLTVASAANAQETSSNICEITNTGAGSTNTCTINDNNVVTITCTNGVSVENGTVQTANSGSATVNGNTVSGNVVTGEVSNESTIVTDLQSFCLAVNETPEVPTTPVTPTTPQVESATVAVLPATGENDAVKNIAIFAVIAGVAAIALKLGAAAFTRK